MNDDRYKSCFLSIVIILLVIIAMLVIPCFMTSCRSTKSSSVQENATAEAVTTSRQDLAAIEQQRFDRSFTISLDSLELWLPVGQDELLPLLPDTATLAQRGVAQSRSNGQVPVLLKARRANISSGTAAERTVVQTVQIDDSTRTASDTTTNEVRSSDVVAVAHPVPPWIYIIGVVLIFLVISLLIYRKWK